jgi:hypothetical protein
MRLLLVFLLSTHLLSASNDLINKIPEYGKASVRIKDQKVPAIKAKEGAILENVVAKNITVKKLIFARKLKAEKIFLDDCMAFLQDGQVTNLEGLAVCQINSAIIQKLQLKGHLSAAFLKSDLILMQGQCLLSDSDVKNMEVTADKVELKNTKVHTLTVMPAAKKKSVVILKNSSANKIIFIGTKGTVIKRDHKSFVLALENGKEELIF